VDLQLRDRVVVITGASAGIGRATSLALAREGCRLALGARGSEKLDGVAQDVRGLGAEAVTVAGDLVNEDVLQSLVAAAKQAFGGIDGLVTCVGATPLGDFDELTDAIWTRAFEHKFLATVRAIRSVLPAMLDAGRGRIVILAGNAAHDPIPWMATSGAMNAALTNLAGTLARRHAADGIGVVCVSPGPVSTDRYSAMRLAVAKRLGVDVDRAGTAILERVPDGRTGMPSEVAALIAHLLSPVADHINGTSVVIDGAQTWL
jgi:3-oxoacyl-[acyl-carrier protein] reductase